MRYTSLPSFGCSIIIMLTLCVLIGVASTSTDLWTAQFPRLHQCVSGKATSLVSTTSRLLSLPVLYLPGQSSEHCSGPGDAGQGVQGRLNHTILGVHLRLRLSVPPVGWCVGGVSDSLWPLRECNAGLFEKGTRSYTRINASPTPCPTHHWEGCHSCNSCTGNRWANVVLRWF